MTLANSRNAARHAVDLSLRCSWGDAPTIAGRVVDLSSTGALLELPVYPQYATTVTLTFDDPRVGQALAIAARVVRVGDRGMGVRFHSWAWNPEDRARLFAAVARTKEGATLHPSAAP
jgi:hypothetical protein